MDELTQNALVSSEGVGGIEAAQTGATQGAAPVLVQWKGILERRPATGAEEFRAQGFRFGDAAGANGVASDLAQGFAADTAGIGKDQGKKGVGDGTDC
jgi:hypothetical protein